MAEIIKEYSQTDITVIWKPNLCIHAAECVKGLPKIFNPDKRPWIDINAANSSELKETIDKCPSGALTYKSNTVKNEKEAVTAIPVKLSVLKNGPLIVDGNFEIFDAEGNKLETKKKAALCRCGASNNHPFCDGSHAKIDFVG